MRVIKSTNIFIKYMEQFASVNSIKIFRNFCHNGREQIIAICAVLLVLLTILFWRWKKDRKKAKFQKMQIERYEQLCALANEYMYEYNILDDTLEFSAESARFLGCPTYIRHASDLKNKSSMEEGENLLLDYIMDAGEGMKEHCFRLPNGKKQWLFVVSKVITDQRGSQQYSIGKITDIQTEKLQREKLIKRAIQDGLTKLYNQKASKESIENYLYQMGPGEKAALFIIDIDNFKKINDKFGHYSGDEVLIHISKVLKKIFGKEDIVGRLGGDEFIVLMKNIPDYESLKEKCELCKENLKGIYIKGTKEEVKVSVGVATAKQFDSFMQIYQLADEALYKVKNNGKNNFEINMRACSMEKKEKGETYGESGREKV